MAVTEKAQIKIRVGARDRALIAAAAQKLGVSAPTFVLMRALADVHEGELEARIRAAVASEVSELAASIAAEVQTVRAGVAQELAALDGRMKNALTQIHAAIKNGGSHA